MTRPIILYAVTIYRWLCAPVEWPAPDPETTELKSWYYYHLWW